MTMVQDPKTAKFDGMPRSAIARGDVDFVLPAEKMAYSWFNTVKAPAVKTFTAINLIPQSILPLSKKYLFCCVIEQATICRLISQPRLTRIARRMNIHRIKNSNNYVQFLQENPIELDNLFTDLLINVTSFFRDVDAFDTLSSLVLPKLF